MLEWRRWVITQFNTFKLFNRYAPFKRFELLERFERFEHPNRLPLPYRLQYSKSFFARSALIAPFRSTNTAG